MRTLFSLSKQATVLVLSGVLVTMAGCGSLEAALEPTATPTIADRITGDDRTSDQVPELTAISTSVSISIAATDVEARAESPAVAWESVVTEGNATETTVTVTPTPEFTDWDVQIWSSSSPHGTWAAQTTAAFPMIDGTYVGEDTYYTHLKVTGRDHAQEWTVVDEWSVWALGYTTPQPFHWSRDSRYLYFTNRPQPDGCALFTNGSDLQRLDLSDGTVTEIMPSVGLVLSLSPDEQTLAYVGYQHRGMVLRELATGKERNVNMDDGVRGSTGSLVWSPDGTALMLTVAFPKCAPEDQRMHSIVRVDVETLSATTVIDQDPRLLTTAEWPEENRVVLIDETGDRWGMDPMTGQMAREE